MPRRILRTRPLPPAFGWNVLRGIGNSPFAKSALLVPVLGYFLLFNEQVIAFLRTHTDLCADCSIPWRLQCLYLAGWAFTLGSLVYAWACPAMVKKYADAADYLAGERATMDAHGHGTARDVVAMYEPDEAVYVEMELRQAALKDWTGKEDMLDQLSVVRPASEEDTLPTAVGIAAYRRLNESGETWRVILIVLYAIGAALLAIPSLATLWVVAGRVGIDMMARSRALFGF